MKCHRKICSHRNVIILSKIMKTIRVQGTRAKRSNLFFASTVIQLFFTPFQKNPTARVGQIQVPSTPRFSYTVTTPKFVLQAFEQVIAAQVFLCLSSLEKLILFCTWNASPLNARSNSKPITFRLYEKNIHILSKTSQTFYFIPLLSFRA